MHTRWGASQPPISSITGSEYVTAVIADGARSAGGMFAATWAAVVPESNSTISPGRTRRAAAAPIRAFSSRRTRSFVA